MSKINGQKANGDMYKLILNSLYGKSCENPEKRSNIKLVTNEKDFLKCSSNNWFKDFHVIEKDFRIYHFNKYKCTIDKPIYIGMCCLWLSKYKMQRIWYDYLQKLYPDSLKLLMTDTDSFIFECSTKDFYRDISENEEWMKRVDTGNINSIELIKKGIIYNNTDQTGSLNLIKMEENENNQLFSIKEFVGIKPKMYAYTKVKVGDGTIVKMDSRVKGLNTDIRKTFGFDVYKNVLLNGTSDIDGRCTVRNFRTINMQLYTMECNKSVFTSFDNKRYYVDNINSKPYGWQKYEGH